MFKYGVALDDRSVGHHVGTLACIAHALKQIYVAKVGHLGQEEDDEFLPHRVDILAVMPQIPEAMFACICVDIRQSLCIVW